MAVAIAYTAVEKTGPFGTLAIRALFNDANNLGHVVAKDDVTAFLNKGFCWDPRWPDPLSWVLPDSYDIETIAQFLGDIVVEFAGALAFYNSDVTQSKARLLIQGVLDLSSDETDLALDISSILWKDALGCKTRLDPINIEEFESVYFERSADDVFASIRSALGFKSDVHTDADTLLDLAGLVWGASTRDIFDRLHIATRDDLTTITLSERLYDVNSTATVDDTHVDVYIAGDHGETIAGTMGNDLIFGGSGNDTFRSNGGRDFFYGGSGNDTFVSGSKSSADDSVFVDGGDGEDIADYKEAELELLTEIFLPTHIADVDGLFITVSFGARTDTLVDVEKVNMGDEDDTVHIGEIARGIKVSFDLGGGNNTVVFDDVGSPDVGLKSLISQAIFSTTSVTIDLGAKAGSSSTDTLDFSQYGSAVYLRPGSGGNLELFTGDSWLPTGTGYSFKDFTRLELSADGDDHVRLTGAGAASLQQVDTGNGNVIIESDVTNLEINLGHGKDTVKHVAQGTVVNAGGGEDTFYVSDDVLLVGVKPTDHITMGGWYNLTGGIQWAGLESPYAIGIDGTRYGINYLGDLVIKDIFGDTMYVANYVGGPGVPYAYDTAGIFIAKVQIDSYRLLDPNLPTGAIDSQLAFGNALAKAYLGLSLFNAVYNGVDPIVLDLTGAGLNLMDTSSVAPRFDMNSDGFAVHTGWVQPNVGFLVLDRNGNGQIDNIGEMFGGMGQDGFAALAAFDDNHDGVIDSLDAIYSQLKVWVDQNGDGQVESGELETLAGLGITSINLNVTSLENTFVAGNQVLATTTFTRADGSFGTAADVSFHTDNLRTVYLGDSSVTAEAAALPDLKGYGTLSDLRVAMSHDPAIADPALGKSLISVVETVLPTLDLIDLAALRERIIPILTAWTVAVQKIDSDGHLISVPPSGHAGLWVFVTATNQQVTNFVYEVTDAEGSYWKLADGGVVRDDQGKAIQRPTLAQVVAQTSSSGSWSRFDGAYLDFFERYTGNSLPIGAVPHDPAAALMALSPLLTEMWQTLDTLALSLAMQGPLASYFSGIVCDVGSNTFRATTDEQLSPMYEAIFAAAPPDAAGAAAWLAQWKPIIDVMLGDFSRGDALEVTFGYTFASMVHAYETVGLAIDINAAAEVLGIPEGLIVNGGGSLNGTSGADIFYLSGGDQTAIGGLGTDNYVMGGSFGHDTIIDFEPAGGAQAPNILRFTSVKSTDVTAYRDGEDLVIDVTGTDEQVRVVGEFHGVQPGLFGGNLADAWGVAQIAFSDGVVWDLPDIAWAVAPNTDGVGGRLIGTPSMDVLDGGRGNHFMSGGDGGDIYLYDRLDGADIIQVGRTDILITNPNYVKFGPGISAQDVIFSLDGNSEDLIIRIKDDPDDSLTIKGEFAATFTGVFGTQYLNQIQIFAFSDGTWYSWLDVEDMIIAQAVATPGAPIYGFDTDDFIDPGPGGGRYISGGNGDDIYAFGLGYGDDTIKVGMDNILSVSRRSTVLFNADVDPSTVQVIRDGNSDDFRIVLEDGSTLTILRQFSTAFTGVFGNIRFDQVSWFQFRDADNTLWSAKDIELKALAYETTVASDAMPEFDHVIYGFSDGDVIDPGIGGNAFMSGGEGFDTYIFGLGYGHDEIFRNVQNVIADSDAILLFNPDVDPSTVSFARGGDPRDLIITLADGSELDIIREFDPWIAIGPLWLDTVWTFQFQDANHTVLSLTDIEQIILTNELSIPNSTIEGFYAGPVLDGYAGNQTLIGEDGGSTFVFGLGYGHETILCQQNSYFASHFNVVEFGAGVTPDMLVLSRDQNDLEITIAGTSDRLSIPEQFKSNAISPGAILEFRFTDGTVMTLDQLQEMVLNQKTAAVGEDICGFSGRADTIVAGLGDRYLNGLAGGDTYVYSSAGGNDVIDHTANLIQSPDRLVMQDIASTGVTLSRAGTSSDLILTMKATGRTVTIKNELNWGYAGVSISFSDGVTWSRAQIEEILVAQQSETAAEAIYGIAKHADTLVAGLGNRYLNGLGGGDTFVYTSLGGNDIIDAATTLLDAPDTLVMQDIASSEVTLSRKADSSDYIIMVNTTGKTVTVKDGLIWSTGGLTISFADGVNWNRDQVEQILLDQASARDGGGIYGFAHHADTIVAGLGDKYLNGLGGGDTFIYTSAGGNDVIAAATTLLDSPDTLVMQDIASSEVTLSRKADSNDVIVTVITTGKTITIKDGLIWSTGGFAIVFADGVRLSREQVEQVLLDQASATAGSAIYGYSSRADTIVAGLGDRYLNGLGGGDTYVYTLAGGNDVIDDRSGTLVMQDIASTAVTLFRNVNSNDLVLTVDGTGRTITIRGELDWASNGLAITFADGVNWSRDQVEQILVDQASAIAGGDIYGFSHHADTIIAGIGDRYLNGLGGGDTYVYTSAGGNDVIDDTTGTLVMPDIASTAVTLFRDADSNHLVLTVNGTGKTITIKGELDWAYKGLAITFADGVCWSRDQIEQFLLDQASATVGASIYGFSYKPDTIVAGLGDRYLNGLGGGDTYVYTLAGGNDVIGNNSGTLVMQGIGSTEVALCHSTGNDLVIKVLTTGKTISVKNEFSSTTSGLSIDFEDGVRWSIGDIINIAANAIDIYGTSGADVLTLPGDGRTVYPGQGDDTLNVTGSGGNRTLFARGDGHDTLNNTGSGYQRSDTLGLVDILPSEVVLSRSGNQLTILVSDTGDSFTITSQFASSGTNVYGINAIEFADGTVWDRGQITAAAWYYAGTGNVTLTALDGGQTLIAGPGNDTFNGGSASNTGNNTYVYAAGNGNLTINDHRNAGVTPSNTLLFSDLNASDVVFSRSGSDLLVAVTATGKVITIAGNFKSTAHDGVQRVQFADGSVWDRGEITAAAWYRASASSTAVTAQDGDATMAAGPGSSTLTGGDAANTGNITYVYELHDGNLLIKDHRNAGITPTNTLLLPDLNASDVVFSRSGSDLLVTVPATGKVITISGSFNSANSDGVQQVRFADGTMWDRATIVASAWVRGTSGNDNLTVPSNGVTVDAGAGDDTISVSGSGSDRIVFAKGSGHDTLTNPGVGYQRDDTLVLTDIRPSEIQLSHSGDKLIVSVTATGDTFTVNYQFYNGGTSIYGINAITFVDGTVWDRATIAANAWVRGTAGNDSLTVPSDGVTVDAGAGDDTISVNGTGRDRIVFAKGYGHDTLTNPGSGYQRDDTLVLTDILPSEVQLSHSGDKLIVGVTATGDTFTVTYQFYNGGTSIYGINAIAFADGTVWDRATIGADAWVRATSGNDSLTVPSDGVTVDAGAGDDTISVSGTGRDTIVFGKGYGHDTLTNPGSGYQRDDTLSLADILSPDVQFTRSGDKLIVSVLATGDTFTVNDQFYNGGTSVYGINTIAFADGTRWDRSSILDATSAFTWSGSVANATLTGNDYGVNLFQLGGGEETANGGARSNVFQVTRGTDQATINLSPASGSKNEIDFLGDITVENLWLEQAGNDLKIDLLGTTTSITVNGWFSGSSSALQEITAGGLKLDSQVAQLVQAMASYCADNPGFDPASAIASTLPNDNALQNAVAAAWH